MPVSLFPHNSETEDNEALARVAARYAVRVTDTVREAIESPDDPVARQYLPSIAELSESPEENPDPIGDTAHSPAKGIVHRYPDRVLLTPVAVCAVYCRFCFRRENVGPGKEALSGDELEQALSYIRDHQDIYEVILTGGDPLILSPRRLAQILDELESMPHVQVIRIHTRVPVADPKRINEGLCAALTRKKALYVSIHTNHVQEITAAAEKAFAALRAADCVLISQTVLLRGVNDNATALEDLFRRLVALRVKPYYLHHPDLAPGTGHFRLDPAQGQELMVKLRGRLSGLCQPAYVIDIPGGHGKVPAGPSFIRSVDGGGWILHDSKGAEHVYPPVKKEKS